MPAISQLYEAFDKVYRKPTRFTNEGCCVKRQHEKPLLTLPREQLTEEMLDRPMSHACLCFGTLEEVSYFVPRLIEILADSDDGLEMGSLNLRLPGLLLDNRVEYEAKGLWGHVEKAYYDIWLDRSASFILSPAFPDSALSVELIDSLLRTFFWPLLSERQSGLTLIDQPVRTAWDDFIDRWAADENPARVAHLVDFVRRYHAGFGFDGALPSSFISRTRQLECVDDLLRRALPAVEPTLRDYWLEDTRRGLEQLDHPD